MTQFTSPLSWLITQRWATLKMEKPVDINTMNHFSIAGNVLNVFSFDLLEIFQLFPTETNVMKYVARQKNWPPPYSKLEKDHSK